MNYTLKTIPQDFIVEEISKREPEEKARFLLLKLTKTNLNTLDVVKILARETYQNQKSIGFAGLKDKHAQTTQYITIPTQIEKKLEHFSHKQIKLEKIGYTSEPLTLGDLKENKFTITIRNLEEKKTISPKEAMPNYFGKQRFSKANAKIGKLLFKKEFAKALELIDEPKLAQLKKENPQNPIAVLKHLPLRHLRIYTNAYQSLLFNKLLANFLEQTSMGKSKQHADHAIFFPRKLSKLQEKFPLIGFETKQHVSTQMLSDINELLRKEQITYHDFLIRQIPPLSAMGELREPSVQLKELNIGEMQEDELNQGKYKCTLSFTLPKSSYATMAIAYLLESAD